MRIKEYQEILAAWAKDNPGRIAEHYSLKEGDDIAELEAPAHIAENWELYGGIESEGEEEWIEMVENDEIIFCLNGHCEGHPYIEFSTEGGLSIYVEQHVDYKFDVEQYRSG